MSISDSNNRLVSAQVLNKVLTQNNSPRQSKYYSFFDGSEITADDHNEFLDQISNTTTEYEGHLLKATIVNGITFLYVCVDPHAEHNDEYVLVEQLINICGVVSECLRGLGGGDCVVFFSQSRSPIRLSWFKMRSMISNQCSLEYLGDSESKDVNVMAFCAGESLKRLSALSLKRFHDSL